MIQTSLIIEVEVVYDTDDTEIIEIEIKANGSCKKVDKRTISKDNSLERYLLDVNMDSLTWNKKEYSTTVNKCIAEHIENNKKEIHHALCTKLIEKYENK